mgnify:FL=1
MKITNAKKSRDNYKNKEPFNKKEYKNKITTHLNSKINKKINNFNKMKKVKSNKCKKKEYT